MTTALGLLLSLMLYLGAIYGFVWTGERQIAWAARRGVVLGPKPEFPSAVEIWKRHSVEWAVFYGGFFLLLGITGFPLWQRLGIGALAALLFGSIWFAQGSEEAATRYLPRSRRVLSEGWYWLLAVLDWLGFMWVLCFFTALVLEIL